LCPPGPIVPQREPLLNARVKEGPQIPGNARKKNKGDGKPPQILGKKKNLREKGKNKEGGPKYPPVEANFQINRH